MRGVISGLRLHSDKDVIVVHPGIYGRDAHAGPDGVEVVVTPVCEVSRLSALGPSPYEAQFSRAAVRKAIEIADSSPRNTVVYWENAQLASIADVPATRRMGVIEFANDERGRFRAEAVSAARGKRFLRAGASLLEAAKSHVWQRRVLRRADLTVALNLHEADRFRDYSANVMTVPNGVDALRVSRSSRSSTSVLAVASWWYEPNRDGLEYFLKREWAATLATVPEAVLRVVGPGSRELVGLIAESCDVRRVEAVGFVDDLSDEYRNAALVLAPARSGAGSQLKIAGALAHGRVVVGPAFLAREVGKGGFPELSVLPAPSPGALIGELLVSVERRHRGEAAAESFARRHSWREVTAPLAARLADPQFPRFGLN